MNGLMPLVLSRKKKMPISTEKVYEYLTYLDGALTICCQRMDLQEYLQMTRFLLWEIQSIKEILNDDWEDLTDEQKQAAIKRMEEKLKD